MTWKAHGLAIFRHIGLTGACLLVAGCAGLEKPAAPASQPAPIVVAPTPAPAPQAGPAPAPAPSATADATPAYGSSKTKRGPLPVRALNVRSDCSFKDETGYNRAMKLRVVSGLVQEFNATVNHPKHGSCNFALDEFRQIKDLPIVELKGERSKCTVRMWEQGRQVAVAFSACNANCTGRAVDYLWPILADAYNGTCG